MLERIHDLLETGAADVVRIEADGQFAKLEIHKGRRHLVRTFT